MADKWFIIKCPECQSEIGLEDKQHFDIDCDCGAVITQDNYKGTFEVVKKTGL